MTSEEFEAALRRLQMSRQEFAALIGATPQALGFWGTRPGSIPRIVATVLDLLQEMRIPAPPAYPSADQPAMTCADVLEPHLDRLRLRAEAAGWQRAEILSDMLAWAASNVADAVGAPAALSQVELLAEQLRSRAEGRN